MNLLTKSAIVAIGILIGHSIEGFAQTTSYGYQQPATGYGVSPPSTTTHIGVTQTGAVYSTTYDSNGSHGMDSNGNVWNYNAPTGVYQNYGTGEMRFNKPRR